MKPLFLLFLLLMLNLLPEASAQELKQKGSLSDIAFIEGHWLADDNGKTIEAVWSAPSGDNMVGFIRMMENGKASLYELFAFEQTANGPIALVKHFKPGLIGLEDKDKSDRYHFLEAAKGKAYFEKEGQPLRVLYEKRPGDKFAIVLGNLKEGKWVYADLWEFSKMK